MAGNPYVPTDAIPPQYFAGRKEILDRADRLVQDARRGVAGGLLLSGHRGIGKTSALRALEARLPRDISVVRIRFSRSCDLAEFAGEVMGHVRAATRTWKARVTGADFDIPFVTVRLKPSGREEVTPQLALLETLQGVRSVKALWLSLDDMGYVRGDALSLMKSAMEEAGNPTLVLAVAGGPGMRQRLISEHSPIIRFFTGSDFDLGNFSLSETREALDLPLQKGRVRARWTDEAAREVHRWTGGYPYLIQCLAHAAFQDGEIGVARVRESIPKALRAAGTWMDQEIPRASDRDVRMFDRIASGGKGEWRSSELNELGVDPVYVGRLVKLGVLRKVARGLYVVVKPPMIARYHMWRRGLE